MAIAFDTSVNGGTSATNSITWNHTTTGSNILVVVFLFQNDPTDDITVTLDGASMTKIATSHQGSDANKMSLFYMTSVSAAAHTIVGTAHTGVSYFTGGSASYTGVLGSLDNSTTAADTGKTSEVTTLTVNTANSWAVLGGRWSGNVLNASTGSTKRQTTTADYGLFDSNGALGAGSNSMTITQAGGADSVGTIMASFSPTAGGGGTALPYRALLGVGI